MQYLNVQRDFPNTKIQLSNCAKISKNILNKDNKMENINEFSDCLERRSIKFESRHWHKRKRVAQGILKLFVTIDI